MVDARLPQRLRGARDDVADLRSRLGALAAHPDWSGATAEAYRDSWQQHAAALDELSELLTTALAETGPPRTRVAADGGDSTR